MTAPLPRRTYVDQGITYDTVTGQPLIVPSVPWRPKFHWLLKVPGFVALMFVFAEVGGGAPAWLVWLSWLVMLASLSLFFTDSVRKHPSAWGWLAKSVAVMVAFKTAQHAYRVHERHRDERMASAIADEFEKRGL